MRKVLWTPHYRPALDTTLLSRLWTLTLPDSSPSDASGHQIAVAQACGLKLNLCHKNSLLRLLRLSNFWTNTWHMKSKLLKAPFWARTSKSEFQLAVSMLTKTSLKNYWLNIWDKEMQMTAPLSRTLLTSTCQRTHPRIAESSNSMPINTSTGSAPCMGIYTLMS